MIYIHIYIHTYINAYMYIRIYSHTHKYYSYLPLELLHNQTGPPAQPLLGHVDV